MSNMIKSLYNVRLLDELGEKKTLIHSIHPLIKVLTTCVFLVITVSFGKYELGRLLPLFFYPVVVMALADIPTIPILKRVLIGAPFIIGIGIFNPIFDIKPVVILPWIKITRGWISFFSLLVKGILTMLAALILIATTGMTRIALALRMLKLPKIFIMQLLLTYRYISVLIEEVGRTVCAYSLRSPNKKGIKFSHWGSLTGQLLMRTWGKAQRVYNSMCCRGFTGDYNMENHRKIGLYDLVYFVVWSLYFLFVRYFDITRILGLLLTGVMR